MLFKDPKVAREVRNRTISKEMLLNYLLKECSTYDVANTLADKLLEEKEETEPILISREQFVKFFKVKGFLMDECGTEGVGRQLTLKIDGRGRPQKSFKDLMDEKKEGL